MNETQLDWSDVEGLGRVVAALGGGGRVRLVGGCVRDRLLGRPVGDIDLATLLEPQEVIEVLESAGLKAIPTGFEHGTVTALSEGRPFEITTLRRDVATDGRRAVVAFSTDWNEDAHRRDFTINALYCDTEDGRIYDYVGGLVDLDGPVVRFIGDPAERIAEDYLRILRYFRFLARFGCREVDRAAMDACHAARTSLMTLSRERVSGELVRLLAADDPSGALGWMSEIDLFANFMPEFPADAAARVAALVEAERRAAVEPCAERRLSALLPTDAKVLKAVSARMTFSGRMRDRLLATATAREALRAGETAPRKLAYRCGREEAVDALLIEAAAAGQDPCDALSELKDWRHPDMPIKGGELIRRGLEPGPAVSQTLREIERRWIAEDFCTGDRFERLVSETMRAKGAAR